MSEEANAKPEEQKANDQQMSSFQPPVQPNGPRSTIHNR